MGDVAKGGEHKAKSDPVGNTSANRARTAPADLTPAKGGARIGRPAAEDLANRCTAKSRTTQERCRQPAILGGNVCRYHGGSSPQVQRSARARLAELVMPSINTLNYERENAESSADRQKAANSILDRAGLTRGHSAEVDVARALLLERILTLRAEAGQPDPLELLATVAADDDSAD